MGCQVKALIAEDNFLVGEMIQGVAEDAGCTIVGRATDGRQAVEMTNELHPDVVLMDIKMPELDGIQAAEIIQIRCPTPVVILTAWRPSIARPTTVHPTSSATPWIISPTRKLSSAIKTLTW